MSGVEGHRLGGRVHLLVHHHGVPAYDLAATGLLDVLGVTAAAEDFDTANND